jgi:hypothetical protein
MWRNIRTIAVTYIHTAYEADELLLINAAFDPDAMVCMNLALNHVCKATQNGEQHELRKRVALRIIECARGGGTTLAELTAAGQRGLLATAWLPG